MEKSIRSENLIFITVKQNKNSIIYYCILTIEIAHFYGSHNYKDLILKKLDTISNNYSIDVYELSDIKTTC